MPGSSHPGHGCKHPSNTVQQLETHAVVNRLDLPIFSLTGLRKWTPPFGL